MDDFGGKGREGDARYVDFGYWVNVYRAQSA